MHKFVLHKHHRTCKSCGETYTYPRLYTQAFSRNSDGVELTPYTDRPDAPVAVIDVEASTIPCCHNCAAQFDNISQAENARRWKEALARHHEAHRPIPVTPKSETIDDIL